MGNGRFEGGALVAGLLLLNPITIGLTYAGSIIVIKTYVETLDAVVATPVQSGLEAAGVDQQLAESIGVYSGIGAGILIPLLVYWCLRGRRQAQEA